MIEIFIELINNLLSDGISLSVLKQVLRPVRVFRAAFHEMFAGRKV